jgi:arsenate reductase
MPVTIYHNPRCSKSRESLRIIGDAGVEPVVVEYLKSPPDAPTILKLAGLLGQPVAALLRRGEAEFTGSADIPELSDDAAVAAWLQKHPKVLQRPIVVNDELGKAVVGRPPENVLIVLS